MFAEQQVHPVILKDLLALSHPSHHGKKKKKKNLLSRVQETLNERNLIFKMDHTYLVISTLKIKNSPWFIST